MRRFDVHAHAVVAGTDATAQRITQQLIAREGFAGSVPGAGWTADGAIEFMDQRGIALQLLSMPGALGAEQARAWNEQTAEVVVGHAGRFGLLAALPMAEPGRALEEIDHAVNELDADGFAVATNYDGMYFGDSRFEPVFAELDRRGMPLFVHPALPPAFDRLGLGRPGPLVEYPMDTARTVVDAVFAGVLLRHRSLRMILAHTGGVLPALADRISLLGTQPWVANPLELTSEQLRSQLAALYLDTAIGGGPAGLRPAIDMSGADHLVFGTDYPPAGTTTIDHTIENLHDALTSAEASHLEDTFRQLFPRAARRAAP